MKPSMFLVTYVYEYSPAIHEIIVRGTGPDDAALFVKKLYPTSTITSVEEFNCD